MVQLDGTLHDWFEGGAPWCTLLVFIDDATSRFLWLQFVTDEPTLEVMHATQAYIKCRWDTTRVLRRLWWCI